MIEIENAIPNGNKKNSVLVAEDNRNLRKLLNLTLRDNGFEVIEAIDGNDAYNKILKGDVDIVISDVMMPGMNGLELCQKIKNKGAFKKVYFILLSAKGTLNDKVVGLEFGADEYISKPFEPVELVARVKAGKRIVELQNELEKETRYFEMLAFTDELTKLYNRRFFNEVLNREYENAKRYQYPVSIILIDIDHFKSFNDTYNHSTGDKVLQKVAVILKDMVRKSDTVARYGGEEFVILLPNTQKSSAIELAERLRKTIEDTKVDTDYGELRVTVSGGIGFWENHTITVNSPHAIFEQADKTLLKAKQTGRNRVCYE